MLVAFGCAVRVGVPIRVLPLFQVQKLCGSVSALLYAPDDSVAHESVSRPIHFFTGFISGFCGALALISRLRWPLLVIPIAFSVVLYRPTHYHIWPICRSEVGTPHYLGHSSGRTCVSVTEQLVSNISVVHEAQIA